MDRLAFSPGLIREPEDALDELVPDMPARLIELMPVAVYVCAQDGTIVRCNRRAVELWGRTPKLGDPTERFCGSYRLYRLDGAPLPHAACPMADVLHTGIPARDQEIVIERLDGSRAVALVNIDPIKDSAGEIVGAINCFQDITARKRTEQELRATRRDLEDFFENAVVPMHWVGADGTILRANQAELDLLGYDREDYVGRHIADFHADRPTIDDILSRLARGENLVKYPARLRARNGSIRHVLISSNVQFRNGEFIHTRCVTLDVTAERRTEVKVNESERRFRELLDAIPAAVYTTDAAGRITYYNQAAVDLWGCRPELGKSEFCGSWRLYWPDGRPMPHDQCPMAVALKEGRPIRDAEALAERPDGTRVLFTPYPTPLFDASGALSGAVNMLVDITARRREEELANCQRDALAMLADGAPLGEVLDFLVRTVERHSGGRLLGSIVPLNDGGTHFQRGIGASLPEEFNAAVEGIAVSSFNGICCHAVSRREPVVVSDFGADPQWAHFAEFVAPYGLRAGWSAPIFGSGGTVLGTFANYYRQPCDPTPPDLPWVEVVTRTAAIAIERRRAELRDQQLVSIVESSDDAIVSKDLNGTIVSWNRGAERLFGYAADEIIGEPITTLFPPDRLGEEDEILGRIRRGERVETYETVRRRKDGSLIDVSLTVSPIKDAAGRVIGASKIARDITDRKQADARQRLLIRELNHRVKNVLATVQAVMASTARASSSVEEFHRSFGGRIAALARTHALLTEEHWRTVRLQDLLRAELEPYEDDSGRRVRLHGPPVELSSDLAASIGMAVHELTTNAAKHGALSELGGWVEVTWGLAVENGSRKLWFDWTERNGPPVVPPSRKGFGSRLLQRVLTSQMDAQVNMDFAPDGLRARAVIPLPSDEAD